MWDTGPTQIICLNYLTKISISFTNVYDNFY